MKLFPSQQAKYLRKKRLEAKNMGMCITCWSRTAIPSQTRCQICSNKQKKYKKENKEKQKKYHLKWVLKRKQAKLDAEAKRIEYLRRIDEKIKAGILREMEAKKKCQ